MTTVVTTPTASTEEMDPQRNALLGRLPAKEYEKLAARLQPVRTAPRDVVYEKDEPLRDVYFPIDAVFSLISHSDGHIVEVNTIGNEGMVGLPTFLGARTSPNDAYCQVPGRALGLGVGQLREVLSDDGSLHRLLSLYAQATIVQLSQNVACNRLHSAEQRCARWLLMTHDRAVRDEFPLTHEFLARMLGVRRATVTEIAGRLQDKELIRYRRGVITVLDRENLEILACECYQIIRDESARLLNG